MALSTAFLCALDYPFVFIAEITVISFHPAEFSRP